MTNKKAIKRAILSSALALILCFTSLIGTTFAWFTDSVTSGNNKIQAGTLKIDLELLEKDDQGVEVWTSIKNSEKAIFDYDLWEPGYTDVKVLKVENEGTLALKWKAKFTSETELSKLANVIDVYVKENVETYPTTREEIESWTKVGTVADFVNNIETTTTGSIKAGEEETLGIALKMQETAGNEYQGLSLGGAFDIRILATQDTVEADFLDELYDEKATFEHYVATAEELFAAAAAGGNIVLENDITIAPAEGVVKEDYSGLVISKDAIIDFNGYTINFSAYDIANPTIVTSSAVIVDGDVEVTLKNVDIDSDYYGITAIAGATVNIMSGEIYGGQTTAVYAHSGAIVNIYGGYYEAGPYQGDYTYTLNLKDSDGSDINVYGGSFYKFDPSASNSENPVANFVAEGYTVKQQDNAGADIYHVVPTGSAISSHVAFLQYNLTNKIDVTMVNDIDTTETLTMSDSAINGNGNTLTFTRTGASETNYGIKVGASTGATISNITIVDETSNVTNSKGDAKSLRAIYLEGAGNFVINNVDIFSNGYCINTGSITDKSNLTVSDSTFAGWTSYSLKGGEATFTNCAFESGAVYNYIRPYSNTTFIDCTFDGTLIDLENNFVTAGGTVTFVNCTLNGELITADNVANILDDATNDAANVIVK